MCVDDLIFPCMDSNIHIVPVLSNIQVFNSKTKCLEDMSIARDGFKNVLDYCDFQKLCVVIYKFPELSCNGLKGGLTFPLSRSQIAKNCRDDHMKFHEEYVN